MSDVIERVLDVAELPGGWRLLRLATPLADVARAGQCLRATLGGETLQAAVTRASAAQGWLAVLAPPEPRFAWETIRPHLPAAELQLLGEPFEPPATPSVLIGEDAGIGAILMLAEAMAPAPRLVLLGSRMPLPLRPRPSRVIVAGMPPGTIAGAASLEERGIVSRLAQPLGAPGCYEGDVSALFGHWLRAQSDAPPVLAAGPFGIERHLEQAAGRTLDVQARLIA
jgi:dihydroorotate dehydrogenase electron transfer subunit